MPPVIQPDTQLIKACIERSQLLQQLMGGLTRPTSKASVGPLLRPTATMVNCLGKFLQEICSYLAFAMGIPYRTRPAAAAWRSGGGLGGSADD